jgi:hypothetical protein
MRRIAISATCLRHLTQMTASDLVRRKRALAERRPMCSARNALILAIDADRGSPAPFLGFASGSYSPAHALKCSTMDHSDRRADAVSPAMGPSDRHASQRNWAKDVCVLMCQLSDTRRRPRIGTRAGATGRQVFVYQRVSSAALDDARQSSAYKSCGTHRRVSAVGARVTAVACDPHPSTHG